VCNYANDTKREENKIVELIAFKCIKTF